MFQHPRKFSGHRGAVYALETQGEDSFFSGGAEGWVVRWQAQTGQGELIAKVPGAVLCLHYLAQAELLLIGSLHGEVFWLDLATGKTLRRWMIHPKGVMNFCRSRTGALASVGANGQLTWWDIDRQAPQESWELSSQSLRWMQEHPQQTGLFLLGGSDGALRWLDTRSQPLPPPCVWPEAHRFSVFSACFALDWLWTGGRDAQIRIWEPLPSPEPALLGLVPAHLFTVNDLQFLPDWGLLASASRDKTLKIWEPEAGGRLRLRKVLDAPKYGLHRHSVNRLLPWGGGLLSASDDAEIGFWKLEGA